jgi:hypothetical protein
VSQLEILPLSGWLEPHLFCVVYGTIKVVPDENRKYETDARKVKISAGHIGPKALRFRT